MATCILLDTEETLERTKTDKELPFIFKCRGVGSAAGRGLEKQTERHKGRLGVPGKEARESGIRRKSTPNSISTIYIYCTVLIYILRFLNKEETCSKGQG